ncbi:MAG: ATPase, T2SS/T4P/T4SS family [Pseudomonadota bacterium]
MNENETRLGGLLAEKGLLQDSDLRKALHIQSSSGGRLGAILVRIGAISEESLLRDALGGQLGLSVLEEEDRPDEVLAYECMLKCPVAIDWFVDHKVVLWPLQGDRYGCIAADVLDNYVRDVLERQLGFDKIRYHLATQQIVDSYVDFVRRENAVDDLFQVGDSPRALAELAEEAPIVEFVNNIMAQALDAGASDIHVEPGDQRFAVRFRVDGVLHTRLTQPQDRYPAVASRIKLIAKLDIAERRLPQDGRLSTRVSGKEMDIRVSTAPEVHGESIVMRLLPKQRGGVSLEELGMEPDHLAQMQRWAQASHGIVLVTGPTGSGKSTTLYSTLEVTSDGRKKIITVEDPVEFQLAGITQIQAHAEIGYTFARALRAILRQDPDVIMIGEIRDLETAEIAVQSALTGHLVLSTLHTNDALSAFNRLIDMGVEPFLVAAPMLGVQAQRLVRSLCPHCAEPEHPGERIEAEVRAIPGYAGGDMNFMVARGCDRCLHTGYRGRSGIYELVDVTPEMHEMIVQNRPLYEMQAQAQRQGNRTLRQDGLVKAACGVTSLEEVFRVTGAGVEIEAVG